MKTQKIKLYVALTVSLFGTVGMVHAQKGEFGVRLMPTFSSFDLKSSGGNTISGDVTYGFGAGAFLGFNFSEHVGVQGEIIYNRISQKYTEFDVEREVKLNYVNIPLLLSLNTGKSKSFNFNMVAGPQLGLSVGSKMITTGGDGTVHSQAILAVKKSDVGVAYGAGFDFGVNSAKTVRLGVGFRGVFGLVDISDNSKNVTTDSFYILEKTKVKTYSGYIGLSILI